jgi:hypothetical protein
MLVKVIRKVTKRMLEIQREGIEYSMQAPAEPQAKTIVDTAEPIEVDFQPTDPNDDSTDETRARQKELLASLDLKK